MKMTRMLPVEQLQIGMYVAQLDRPWLETPFLFQGFYIRDRDEIEEIKAHCKHVYVSRESLPSDPPAATSSPQTEPATTEEPSQKKRFSFRALFRRSEPQQPMSGSW